MTNQKIKSDELCEICPEVLMNRTYKILCLTLNKRFIFKIK